MTLFRTCDGRFPFLWETRDQPPARWHGPGDGPAQYFADTPDGAWAEFLRHEEIRDPEDVITIRRALWAVDVDGSEVRAEPRLSLEILTGGLDTHAACHHEAARLRAEGATSLQVRSAALLEGGARGWRVDGGLIAGPGREGRVIVLFGARTDVVGWKVVAAGRPPLETLGSVRHHPEA